MRSGLVGGVVGVSVGVDVFLDVRVNDPSPIVATDSN